MKHIIKGNVERIVSDDAVAKYEKEGYKLLETAAPETDQAAAQAAAKKKAEEEAKKAEEAAKAAEEAAAKAKAEEEAKAAEEEAAKAAAQAAAGENTAENAETVDYSTMKLNDLRKIAKEKGIQGYNNMDRATLAAVIQAH